MDTFAEYADHSDLNQNFLSAAESAEVGLWFWDIQKEEVFVTPLCNKLFSVSPDEKITYDRFIESVHSEDAPLVEATLQQSIADESDYEIEYRFIIDETKTRWFSVRGKTVRREDSLLMMGSVRDITQQKSADERLHRLYEIEKHAKDRIEEANQQKDSFLAIVSHELRAPLQTILGWAKILLTQDVDDETRQKALQTIENSAKLQAKLISDLVDSAKIISGKLDFNLQPINLKDLINSVFQAQKPMADEKGIDLVLGSIAEISVLGDSLRLQQAVTNLLTNAIKFTPSKGIVLLQLTEKNKRAILRITDNGPGIPPQEIPLIFRQYFQSKKSSNKTGLGLGLSIVKAIIEKHGGEVSAINNDNGIGCTFSINLAVYQNENIKKMPAVSANKQSVSLKNISILIVEDNDDSREVLDFYLSQLGAQIHPAASAREGLSYLTSSKTSPDVIISDISMPEEDGYSFIRKVRNLPDKNSIPAIALTAFASSNDEKKVLEAGFQKYHTKPFQPELLISDILSVVAEKF